ncbi:MAG TPA: TIGR03364 family FAD-dependent oxidoreductase [Burkholderiaceae bacterium]|nr:TIGR03364 family FAD-dependent oxidoreductase [Burkholderiaceae bacterium]
MARNAKHFDLAVVGAGICGLAHALAAARRGKRVVVLDRDAQANGASIRNFGFVTVTGQQAGEHWSRAMRSREVWAEVAAQAGIPILQRGLLVVARRPEARAVLEQFLSTSMGQGCGFLESQEIQVRFPGLRRGAFAGALLSPHELRVESREAIPRLAAFLEECHGVEFLRSTVVHAAMAPRVETSRGLVHADAVVACPGDDFHALHADRIASYRLTRCRLQMLRLEAPTVEVPRHAVMSDLGLVRYLGYAALPAAAALRARLADEQGEHLRRGVHLIVVRSADGSLVVGDSHDDAATPTPFGEVTVDRLILDEYAAVFDGPPPAIREHWTGTYATSADRLVVVDEPSPATRVVLVTSGTGASISFALAEDVIGGLFD